MHYYVLRINFNHYARARNLPTLADMEQHPEFNTCMREMPALALVERSPDGGYIIPRLDDEGYEGSNKGSPAKGMDAVKKYWPGSSPQGELSGVGKASNQVELNNALAMYHRGCEALPMGPMFQTHGFNAFNRIGLNEARLMNHPGYDPLPMFQSQHGFNAFSQVELNKMYVVNHRITLTKEHYALLERGDLLSPPMPVSNGAEIYARKVFVGGLPIDVKEADVYNTFRCFGEMVIDWPKHSERGTVTAAASARTTTGYVFLVYESEASVQMLVDKCYKDDEKLFLVVSSPTMRNKPVQVRPWKLSDTEYIVDRNVEVWPRRTVFIGGLPRPTRALDLAAAVECLYGRVLYVGIDIDPELKYPKGAARVVFLKSASLMAAINGKYVHVPYSGDRKRVEIKPYLMKEQGCDECEGRRCAGRYAPYFCAHVDCMQYYCEVCWDVFHTLHRNYDHKPMVRCGEQTKQLDRPPHRRPQFVDVRANFTRPKFF